MNAGTGEPISDDERAAAVAALRAAAEDGRLDPRVLDARVDLVRAATSRSDIEAALHGLGPAWQPAGRTDGGAMSGYPQGHLPVPQPTIPAAPGYHPDDPLRLTGGVSALRRRGAWQVPPYLRIHALASTVLVDCLDATPTSEVVAVTVVPGAGRVRIVLPPGWALDADRLGRGIGSVKVTLPRRPEPGSPLLYVEGSVGAGSFKATGPSSRERRRRGWPSPR
ncbi:hypothetical protein BN12_3960007 [Nostocoides japonicum T1-X7]|uniref:DUF1707 domain-containing protein n=1 Tax=Nostocoides japonicum T1-X7 TaxID=1194083 RepID=A0A077M4G6_9MICO|nr:DUF1707 domain-containing protein [Tetrasphaera japonica]CCH79015.1 hypothetical protein BN12_3960007 [Tetrasphaera japonica T1-X7]